MGIPTWAQNEQDYMPSSQTTDWTNRAGKFPVHRIENSPLLASSMNREQVTGREKQPSSAPPCQPDEVLFRVQREYETDASLPWCSEPSHATHKMVDLRDGEQMKDIKVASPTEPETMNPVPVATKVMVEQPDVWYRKFSRNIHGLRKDKPYNNLQWPPKT